MIFTFQGLRNYQIVKVSNRLSSITLLAAVERTHEILATNLCFKHHHQLFGSDYPIHIPKTSEFFNITRRHFQPKSMLQGTNDDRISHVPISQVDLRRIIEPYARYPAPHPAKDSVGQIAM